MIWKDKRLCIFVVMEIALGSIENNFLDKKSIRKSILDFEVDLISREGTTLGDSDACPVTHSFADGVYIRQMFIPKGTILSGKIHKHSCCNIILSGDITVVSEEGKKRIQGATTFVSEGGIKRIGHAHEDTIWINIHPNPTNTKDLQKLESFLIAEDYEELEKFIQTKKENKAISFFKKLFKIS